MERGETIVHRMTLVFPLQLEKVSKAQKFEVGSSRSLPLPSIKTSLSQRSIQQCLRIVRGIRSEFPHTILRTQAHNHSPVIVVDRISESIQSIAVHHANVQRIMLNLLTNGQIIFPIHAGRKTIGGFIVPTPSSASATTPGAPSLFHLMSDNDVQDDDHRHPVKQQPAKDGPQQSDEALEPHDYSHFLHRPPMHIESFA